jgi:hypothetical protein
VPSHSHSQRDSQSALYILDDRWSRPSSCSNRRRRPIGVGGRRLGGAFDYQQNVDDSGPESSAGGAFDYQQNVLSRGKTLAAVGCCCCMNFCGYWVGFAVAVFQTLVGFGFGRFWDFRFSQPVRFRFSQPGFQPVNRYRLSGLKIKFK